MIELDYVDVVWVRSDSWDACDWTRLRFRDRIDPWLALSYVSAKRFFQSQGRAERMSNNREFHSLHRHSRLHVLRKACRAILVLGSWFFVEIERHRSGTKIAVILG